MVDTGARVSAIKGEVLKEIYGDDPCSAVQTVTTTNRNYVYLAFIPLEYSFPSCL